MEITEGKFNSIPVDGESRPSVKSTASGNMGLSGIKLSTRLLVVLAGLALICFIPMVLAGDSNPPSLPVTTDPNGTYGSVNGGLYVQAYQPTAWDYQSGDTENTHFREFSQTFTMPDFTSVDWARLYVVVYSGSGINNWPLQMNVSFDSGNNTVTILENATLETQSAISGSCYWVNDHINKVYSDYMAWYDVKGLINDGIDATVLVRTNRVNESEYDGRLKAIELIVAYDDGSEDTTYYWVNQGHDWFHGGFNGTLPTWNNRTTTFDTQDITGDEASSAKLTVLSTTRRGFDATYKFNGEGISSSIIGAPYNYIINNTWDITSLLSDGNWIPETCDLNYKNSSNTADFGAGSYKIQTATLAITK